MAAILSQADEILVKPFQIGPIKELIRNRLAEPRPIKRVKVESVASILERDLEVTIQNWLDLVEDDAELTCIPLSRADRTGHLPKLLRDLVVRLRVDSGLPVPISMAARGKTWRAGARTRLQRYSGGRRISYLAGEHLPNFAKEFAQRGLQQSLAGRRDDRG